MQASMERRKVHFLSSGTTCAAWHYPGTNGACVIMAPGLAVTKEPGTDPFAAVLNEAGFTVLAFDYRRFGESGGEPRQLMRIGEQLGDFHAAIEYAAGLPGVDCDKLAIWGFSLSGGHVFAVAARYPRLAAAIAHSPIADGPAATPNALRHQSPLAALRFAARAARDAVGVRLGRRPLLVPLAGKRGTVTSLTTPDSLNGASALNPDNCYPDWQQQVAASSALRPGFYRPGRFARRIQCPLLVLVYDDDGVAVPGRAIRAARRAPRGELAQLPGGHYEAFLGGREQTAEVLLSFLRRHVLVAWERQAVELVGVGDQVDRGDAPGGGCEADDDDRLAARRDD
jgi:pimeloyl-ACP methyl ester carboxylesterase